MKHLKLQLALILLTLLLLSCIKPNLYKDGVYYGKSKAIYNDENFWGNIKITVNDGKIVDVKFKMIDSTNQEIFNHTYEKHYLGNELYMQQCRDDWQGVLKYPDKLIKTQTIEEIDAISGATWSYNLFKYALIEALRDAKIKESSH